MTESEKPELEAMEERDGDIENADAAFEDAPVKERRGLGLVPVLGLSLIAAVAGAVGGAYGTHYLFRPANVDELRAGLQTDFTRLEAETQNAIADIRQTVAEFENRIAEVKPDAKFGGALDAVDDRLQALENAPAPNFPEIDPETLSAIQAAQEDGFSWPSTEAIENSILELASVTDSLEARLDGLNAQVTSLETELRTQADRPQLVQKSAEPAAAVEPDFPKEALLNAANTRADSQGFLSRTLNKHVSVDSPDSPKSLIEKVETAYEKGDIYTAIKTFDRLPSDIRSAGQDWRDAAERLQ